MTRNPNKATLENRLDTIMKRAKPAPTPEQTAGPEMAPNRSRSLPLTLAFLTVLLLFSVTQQPEIKPAPATPAIAEVLDPTIKPSVLANTDETLTKTVSEPYTVFFCGCSRTRVYFIDAFAEPNRTNNI